MPIYEYECKKCDCRFEVLHKNVEENIGLTCPKCNAKNPVRIFSVFSSGESSCGTTSDSVKKGFS